NFWSWYGSQFGHPGGKSTRWYIGNVTLRQLSGCNGQLVGDWIKRHQLSVDDHNNKYGLGQYHNKGRGDVTSVVSW
ncbi:MAG: hypothetical protein C6Y22_27635, partial [Hapalosiphonaceae cyanobacterium JJU2]